MGDHGDEAKIKKRKKANYHGPAGKRSRHGHYLDANMKGFLITCNNREREAVREAYNIFNEYADNIYGPEQKPETTDSEDELDIEAALQKEVSSLKDQKMAKRRFQVVDSGAKNCVFIKTTVKDPKVLTHKLLSDVFETKQTKSRFIMRIHPVCGTCRADADKVRELTESCLSEYMETGVAKTYTILIKVRNNSSFGKADIFRVMRQVVQDMNPEHDFDDKKPDFVFSMDVIKNICCLSVMEDYYKFRKYNIQEAGKVSDQVTHPVVEVTPAEPKQVTGSDLQEVTSAEPKEVTGDLQEVTAAEPKEVTGSDLQEVTAAEPKEVTDSDLQEVTAAEPKDVTGSVLQDVTAAEPKEVTDSDLQVVTAAEPKEVTGSDLQVVTAAEPKEVTGSDLQEVTTAEPKEVASSDIQAVTAGSDAN